MASEVKQVVVPLLHLNGSGKENLMRGYLDALEAVRQAYEAVCRTAPHMRDYYPMQNCEDVFRVAQAEHRDRLAMLETVSNELHLIAEKVYEA